MTNIAFAGAIRALAVAAAGAILFGAVAAPTSAVGISQSPFESLAGRWTGQGRLGIKDNPPETVKCRATYIMGDTPNDLKQTIRCVTAGGGVEVMSNIRHADGELSGSWKETTRNIEGELKGQVTPAGFRVAVRGGDIAANMDIVVRDNKQIVEIQFINGTLQGLTLLMTKG